MARQPRSTGRYVPKSGPIMLALSLLVMTLTRPLKKDWPDPMSTAGHAAASAVAV